MTPAEKDELIRYLRRWQEKLSLQLPSLKEASQPVAPDNAIGRLTRLDAIQAQEINRNAYRQAQKECANIERSLSRADEPDFGNCAECDNPIPLGRLKAIPGSTRCVNCA